MLATVISRGPITGRGPITKTDVLWIVLLFVFAIWALTSKNRGQ